MSGEMQHELSLFVVGIGHPNADGSSRLFELLLCKSGEAVELRLEPKNKHDPLAVAVWSARGAQIGYLSAERCGWVGSKIRAGVPVDAIFQGMSQTVAFIRVRFGGGAPTLPASREVVEAEADFYPDPDPPDWGA